MPNDDRAANDGQERAAKPRSCLFAVRLWTEAGAGGREYRGSVRDVVGGAYRNFRDWSDLTDFMIGRMEDTEHARAARAEGESEWLLEEPR